MLTSPSKLITYVSEHLLEGATSAHHSWHWPVLVTCSGGRVIVLRNYLPASSTVRLYSDVRAQKVLDLKRSAAAELVLYDHQAKIQVRASGKLVQHHDRDLARALWNWLHPANKANYATVLAPGTPLDTQSDGLPENWSTIKDRPEEEERCFKNFTVLDVEIETFDVLQLSPSRSLRCQWESGVLDSFRWVAP